MSLLSGVVLSSAAVITAEAVAPTNLVRDTLQDLTQDVMLADQLFADLGMVVGENEISRSELDQVITALAGGDPFSIAGTVIDVELAVTAVIDIAAVAVLLLDIAAVLAAVVVLTESPLDDSRIAIPESLAQLQQESLVDSIARQLSSL